MIFKLSFMLCRARKLISIDRYIDLFLHTETPLYYSYINEKKTNDNNRFFFFNNENTWNNFTGERKCCAECCGFLKKDANSLLFLLSGIINNGTLDSLALLLFLNVIIIYTIVI